jgi:hypothetical protein
MRWKKIIFAGFNALNPAEIRIISTLQNSGRADVLWDGDRYFLEDPAQEAGKYLRRYRNDFFRPAPGAQHFQHIEDRISTEPKNIMIAGVARMVSQAKAASYFLETLEQAKKYSPSTAIVLADEQLLLPLLHALPENAENINITMGFPLRNTPIADLVNTLFRLHENAQRFSIRSREGELKFYHNDLIRLLRHPYLRRLTSGSKLSEKLEDYITRFNIIFSSSGQLEKAAAWPEAEPTAEIKAAFDLFSAFLDPWSDTARALNGLQRMVELLRPAFAPKEDEGFHIETEYLFQLSLIIRRARTLHERWAITTDIKSLRALITQQLASTSLPFYGEPVAGLQVMGALETRTLDFENVILLSANENIIPGGRTQPSFIIYELRKAFNMPVWNDKDAVSAYHFYRLLQRAKNFFIIYNTDQDTFGSRERSRFVTQLLHELPVANHRATIKETVFDAGIPLAAEPPAPITVPKDAAVLAKLQELAEHGLSPSLLNSYRACSLQFYFHYVAGLREPEEVEETIGADTLGTVIHGALEELFRPLVGKPLTAALLDTAKKNVAHVCDAMFAKHYSSEESSVGKNLLAKRIAVRYITNYIDLEKKNVTQVPASVAALETDLKHSVVLAGGKNVNLRGQADRIDRAESWIRLIDYKTGKAEKRDLYVSDWSEIMDKPEIGKAFQLLMYAWLYSRMTDNRLPVQSGIVSFRKLKEGLMNVMTPEGGFLFPETLDTFERSLILLLENLFDPAKEFVQTTEEKSCKICAFSPVCRRN